MATGLDVLRRSTQSPKQRPLPPFVGESPAIQRARERIHRLKDLKVPVAVIGPTGTGKEIVAQHLHGLSLRARKGALVAVNCSVFPPGTRESVLFGHEPGAFTGAQTAHRGVFEQAHEGTLFLDELAEMPLPVQAMLLRVLEEGQITRMGGETSIPVDVRLVVSSQLPLKTLVEQKRLREDFYYRLHHQVIELPALSRRPRDIAPLVDHFSDLFAEKYGRAPLTLAPQTLTRLEGREWKGNVRELRSALENAYVEGIAGPLMPEHFGRTRETRGAGRPRRDRMSSLQKAREAMEKTGQDPVASAKLLNIGVTTLYRWLQGENA